MAWSKVLLETFKVSYTTILKMTYIIVPLIITIECLKDMDWLERIAARFRGITRLFKLPGEAALGVITGLFAGVILGSGVIMQITEEVKMTRTQINTMFILIGICHAIIDETILFTAIGANAFFILLSRILMALIFCFMYIWIMTCLSQYGKEQKSSRTETY